MSFYPDSFLNKISRYKILFAWIAALLLAIYFIYFIVINADRPSHGFASYYTASRLLLEGEDVSNFYNNDWFSGKVQNFVPGIYEIYHVNLPTTSFILIPVAAFNYNAARIIWTCFNFLILILTAAFIIRKQKISNEWIPLLIIVFLLFQPLYANFSYGQVYVLIFCLLVFAWYAYKSGSEKLLGFIVGLVFILKSTTFIFWILLLVQKRWKSIIWMLSTIVILFVITLPFVGIEAWNAYVNNLINYSSNPSASVTAYQTIHSYFHHLTVFDQQWNPEPIINFPILGKLLSIIFSLFILFVTIFNAYKTGKSDIAFGAFIIAGIVLSPASLDYHYIILIVPVIILIKQIMKNRTFLYWTIFIISFLLIAASLPYNSPKVTKGVLAVFAYPKLYGAIGLWILSLLISFRILKSGDNTKIIEAK